MIKKLAGFAVACLVGACASQPVAIEVDNLAGKGAYPPEPYIAVLGAPPSAPYVPVARLVVTGTSDLTQAQALNALADKAKALGANAVIVTDQSQTTAPNLTFNPAGGPAGPYTSATPQITPKFIGLAIHIDSDAKTNS
jgi:hypothetical protein